MTFTAYMSNNRIRAATAARHLAWLQANGGTPANAMGSFFFSNDIPLASLAGPVQTVSLDVFGFPIPDWLAGLSACSNTVTFGMSPDAVAGTQQFPFVLMNVQVPFMTNSPNSMLSNFTSVSAPYAWPSDPGNDWTSPSALVGVSLPSFP